MLNWFTTPVIGAQSDLSVRSHDVVDDDDDDIFPQEEKMPIVAKGGGRALPPGFDLRSLPDFEAPSPPRLSPFESASPAKSGRRFPWQQEPKLWMHTSHAFGYIAPFPSRSPRSTLPIRPLGSIQADHALKRGRINITLDRLRVRSYPGSGIHRILLHFYAQNQTVQMQEDLHYNTVYRVREGEEAALRGYPLFLGLSVGSIGVRLRCRTINVSNDQDEAFLTFLESDTVKAGLRLAITAQPAIAPLSSIAFGMAKTIGERHRNVAVQDFDLGLDFSALATGARLATGSYLAVQMPQEHLAQWDWQDWAYHAASGLVVLRDDSRMALPYNYLVFGISNFEQGD